MKKQITKDDIDFLMFQDFWKIYTEFGIPEDTNEYWEQLDKKANAFYYKYNKSKFAKALMLAIMDEFERISKQGR